MAANGIEVASTYVTILAKAPGLAGTINKALGSVDVGAASKKIGQQVAESVGKSLKDQVTKKFADATAAALEKQTAATKRLSDAEHALVKARAQHGTASAKVTSAEEKLEALRKSGKATTGDLEKAEAALAKAQADHVGTGRAVVDSQNRVTEAKRNAANASKDYTDALAREKSKSEQALAWMPLANARIDELSSKWRTAGEKISGVGDSLTNNITKPVVIATGAVGTLVSALGFKRLVGLDRASAQFRGLGYDVDAVMEQVKAGVDNTALMMADGAAMAVSILATGNLPLEQLEVQIKRVANVSAAYGVESSHAGYLLNNVLTKNKVTWGDLQQMVQNNIPIVSELGRFYGVAGDEIEKMAQRGEISISDFNAVLDSKAGKAAEEYAKSWDGVSANILANLGKIGAKFLEPTFLVIQKELEGFLELLRSDDFATLAADMGDRVGKIIRDISAGVQSLLGWWNGLSDGQRKFIGVSAAVLVALGPVLKVLGGLFKGISAVIGVGKVVVGLFTGWKVAAGGAAIGSKALTGATVAQTGAMNAAAVAQKVLNAAIWKSPITWIVAGIVALVAGLVWFFRETKLGQAIFAEFMRFLGEAWANISGFFTTAWNDHIKPVFDGIAAVVTWVWQTILQPVFQFIGFAFAVVGGIFVGTYEALIKPVFDAIGKIVGWLWNTIVKPYFGLLRAYFVVIGNIVSWLWTNAVKPVFNFIGALIRSVWVGFVKPVFDAMWAIIKNTLGPVFTWLRDTVIAPVWNGIKAVIDSVWKNGIKPVIDTMVRIVKSDPKKAFEAARDGIKTAWEAIKEIAKKPVRFVVETVINGLIGTMNKIPGVNLSKVSLPKGFAGGGVLPGYMSAKRDDVLMPMRSGEGVLVPEVVRGLGPGFVHALNAAGNSGGVSAVRAKFGAIGQGLAKGGMVHPLPGAVVTTPWMGYPGHTGIDLAKPQGTPVQAAAAGVVSKQFYHVNYGNMVDIAHGGGLSTRYAHMLANVAVKLGQSVKAGQVVGYEGSTGNSTGPHLHWEVLKNGTPVDPTGYLSGANGVKPLFGIIDGLFDFATGAFKKAFPGGGMWIDAAGGLMSQGVKNMVEWATDLLSIGGGTPLLYDNGGWLQPGLSLVNNKSGRPEPVFTAAEFDRMVAGGGGFRDGARFELVLDDGTPLRGYIREQSSHVFSERAGAVSDGSLASTFGRRR